jgi:diguanylate cyclase (GGDEF)-like protein
VVSAQPVGSTVKRLSDLVWRSLLYTLPGLAVSLVLIWLLSAQISKPLAQIARRASHMEDPGAQDSLKRISSWYYEAAQIKASLLRGMSGVQGRMRRLNEEALTDQLTGLANRRALDVAVVQWQRERFPYAVLAFDIDHFKKVNDQFGHDVGDQVLKSVAAVLQSHARDEDLACRLGGEEFALFVREVSPSEALAIAERIRVAMGEMPLETVGSITVSCGVAHLPQTSEDPKSVWKAADVALYRAKSLGRNRTEVALTTDAPDGKDPAA